MTVSSLAVLLLLAAGASYVQTLTGFALGLLFMGGVGLTGAVPLPDAATLRDVLHERAVAAQLKGTILLAEEGIATAQLDDFPRA